MVDYEKQSQPEGLTPSGRVIKAISELRHEFKLSARELAERCDAVAANAPFDIENRLSRSTIAKFESGIRNTVTVDDLVVLSAAFGVPSDVLLNWGQNSIHGIQPVNIIETEASPIGDHSAEIVETLGGLSIDGTE